MADYTPATPQVRAAYVRAMRNAFIASAAEHEAEFDRWLAGVKTVLLDGAAEALEQRWVEHEPLTTLETIAFLRGRANEHRADGERNQG